MCAEYDGLPGLGHACGHDVIAASAVGAAAGPAPVADEHGLRVTVFGTPAEEGGGGRIHPLERGVFDGVHLAMMRHPGPVDVAEADPFAVAHCAVDHRGRAAHAAAHPEQGRNAADAFTVAQVAIGLLRRQLPSGVRVHGVMTSAGEATNAIPEHTRGRRYARTGTLGEPAELQQRVERCFAAGAHATGRALTIEQESPPYAEFRNEHALLAAYRRNAGALGRMFAEPGDPAARMNRASTDMGNVSQTVPAIHPCPGIGSLPAVDHQKEFAAHTAGPRGAGRRDRAGAHRRRRRGRHRPAGTAARRPGHTRSRLMSWRTVPRPRPGADGERRGGGHTDGTDRPGHGGLETARRGRAVGVARRSVPPAQTPATDWIQERYCVTFV
ncbi:amidohydrolase [Streptomyces sp. NRRL S-1868]|uniref:amidohydrolase n=1 Tax=Streptomyces sp. NRRL S-1868 TaxID=1463892 RepID=UPI001F2B97DE|nr:amidohydrolase [Streptomyces sp. NRRL S-1868]